MEMNAVCSKNITLHLLILMFLALKQQRSSSKLNWSRKNKNIKLNSNTIFGKEQSDTLTVQTEIHITETLTNTTGPEVFRK